MKKIKISFKLNIKNEHHQFKHLMFGLMYNNLLKSKLNNILGFIKDIFLIIMTDLYYENKILVLIYLLIIKIINFIIEIYIKNILKIVKIKLKKI